MSTNEWYTRPRYIEAARKVMGSIELDPASCEIANRIVKAERFYAKEQNGLLQEWRTRSLWLNPPYGKSGGTSMQGVWLVRLINEYLQGNVEQAIFLSTANPEANWFQPLWNYLICFADHQVHFHVAHDSLSSKHVFGTCFTYLGPNEARFIEVFSRFGRIVRAVDTPAPKPIARELWSAEVEVSA